MIAYTNYLTDARVRREAETLAAFPEYEVFFLVLKDGNRPKIYTNNRVEIIELDIKKYRGKSNARYIISYIKFLLLAFLICSKLFFKRKFDIIHVHNIPNFLVFAAILPRLVGKKVILDIHDSMPETYSAKFGGKPNRKLFQILCWEETICAWMANKIICVNHVQQNVLIQRGIASRKISISLNVPDHRIFIRKNKNKNNDRNKFKIVYHGTLAKRLGIDLAIRAVAKLTDSILGLEFYVLGHGDDIEEFIELSKQLRMEGNIHFNKKMIPVEDLTAILEEMDMGVIANRKNIATKLMLPVKMLEYVALDIPVVAPRLKTIEYYFNNEMVSYFEPENVDSLTSAILKLYQDELKRKNQIQMARKFLDRYGWENHQMDLIKLYNEF
jgi:glycosyltransferase involved in cell wall biosynthesis